jgi:plasmid stabilization system protein ParE
VPCYAARQALAIGRDLAAIRRHLILAYEEFGDAPRAAAERATARLREAFDYMQGFAAHPHRGTVHSDLQGGIRHVTDRSFVSYFAIDETRAEVAVLAVFFVGADHGRQIAERLAR